MRSDEYLINTQQEIPQIAREFAIKARPKATHPNAPILTGDVAYEEESDRRRRELPHLQKLDHDGDLRAVETGHAAQAEVTSGARMHVEDQALTVIRDWGDRLLHLLIASLVTVEAAALVPVWMTVMDLTPRDALLLRWGPPLGLAALMGFFAEWCGRLVRLSEEDPSPARRRADRIAAALVVLGAVCFAVVPVLLRADASRRSAEAMGYGSDNLVEWTGFQAALLLFTLGAAGLHAHRHITRWRARRADCLAALIQDGEDHQRRLDEEQLRDTKEQAALDEILFGGWKALRIGLEDAVGDEDPDLRAAWHARNRRDFGALGLGGLPSPRQVPPADPEPAASTGGDAVTDEPAGPAGFSDAPTAHGPDEAEPRPDGAPNNEVTDLLHRILDPDASDEGT